MEPTLAEFWRLVAQSGLCTAEECKRLNARFTAEIPNPDGSERLADWLTSKRVFTPYQIRILRSGKPGPFIFGEYVVYERMTAGRLSGLFRAIHAVTRHKVMLLFLAGGEHDNAQGLGRLAKSVEAASRFQSPFVARFHHYVESGPYRFLVVESLRGESLAERLEQQKPIAPKTAARWAVDSLRGLADLHGAGITLDELRPANVFLDQEGCLKLLHFPLSRSPLAPAWSADQGAPPAAGQENYLAPERLFGGQPASPQSDLYSLGCVLFQLLTGQVPFYRPAAAQGSPRRPDEELPRIESLQPTIPADLSNAVARLTAAHPARRSTSAEEAAAAIEPFADPAAARTEAGKPAAAYEKWLRDHPPQMPAVPAPPAPLPPVPAAIAPLVTPAILPPPPPVVPAAVPIPVAPFIGPAPVAPALATPIHWPAAEVTPLESPLLAVARPAPPHVPEPGPAITDPSSAVARVQAPSRKRSQRMAWTVGAALIVMAIVASGLAYHFSHKPVVAGGTGGGSGGQDSGGDHLPVPPEGGADAVDPVPGSNGGGGSPGPEIQSLGDPIWNSPTSGPALDLRYLAPGTEVIVALRPAELLAHPDGGEKLLEAVGPLGQWLKTEFVNLAGVEPARVEQLVVGFADSSEGRRMSMVVRTLEDGPEADYKVRWQVETPDVSSGRRVYVKEDRTWYFPSNTDTKTIVILPSELAGDVVKAGDRPAILPLDLEQLAKTSDSRRLVTVLATRVALESNPEFVFPGAAASLQVPLLALLGSDFKGVMASIHLDQSLFLEVQALASGNAEAPALAKGILDRWQRAPLDIEDAARLWGADPYAGRVLFRLPRWLDEMAGYTRSGTFERTAILRIVQPSRAAHNLALAAYLASTQGEPAVVVGPAPPPQPPAAEQTVADRLKQTASLSFPRDTLERAVSMLGEMIGVEIVIQGSDLQLDGITKNQSMQLDEMDKPAFEILKTIMIKANPDGKLVYVVKNEDGREVLWITTRAKAAERGDAIPPELASP
jgi:serine/threonine-protein kinase